MNGALLLEPLAAAQRAELRAALAGAGMPHEDIDAGDCRFYRGRFGNEVVGFVGLQGNGSDRLLRSLWVRPDRRHRGAGTLLLDAIEQQARASACTTLHLLTTTASRFFLHHGYTATERHCAPPCIAATAEFAALCPSTAHYLVKAALIK